MPQAIPMIISSVVVAATKSAFWGLVAPIATRPVQKRLGGTSGATASGTRSHDALESEEGTPEGNPSKSDTPKGLQ